jgi:hypothetical protein
MARPANLPARPKSAWQNGQVPAKKKKQKEKATIPSQLDKTNNTRDRIPIPLIGSQSEKTTHSKVVSMVKPLGTIPSPDDTGEYKIWLDTNRSQPKSSDRWEDRLLAAPAAVGQVKDALKKAKKRRKEVGSGIEQVLSGNDNDCMFTYLMLM